MTGKLLRKDVKSHCEVAEDDEEVSNPLDCVIIGL